ncbi:MAG TPA: VOC family protein [Myxococcota bacterium]|nr:VOC family protein [Myxococcota bacterium]
MALTPLAIQHVNVNCSNLERSLGFYRDVVGLVPQSHTHPLPQEGAGFGLPGQVRWDAHLLHDDRGLAASAVDLLEWKSPAPIGRPPRAAHSLGLFRLCLTHPDLDALHARLEADGVPCRSEPVEIPVLSEQRVRFLCCDDPDGTCIEFIEMPGPVRTLHVNVNCRDLDASSAWYQRVLGVAPIAERAEPPPADGRGFGLEGECRYRADFLGVPGAEGSFVIDLLEWLEPEPIGEPLVEANHLGLFRLAFMVDDAAESCAELDRLGVEHSGPCWLEMGPEIPIEGLFAVFFRDPDGTCLELIETPKIQDS